MADSCPPSTSSLCATQDDTAVSTIGCCFGANLAATHPSTTSAHAPPTAACGRLDHSRMALLLRAAIQKRHIRPPQQVFPYGNYHSYYGYRLSSAFEEDARLKRGWFEGKDVLDVGCNEGLVSIALAAKFGPRSTVGIDLDPHLVRKATRYVVACGPCKHPTPPVVYNSNLVQERAAVQAVIRDSKRPRATVRAARRHMAGLLYTSFRVADVVHMPEPPLAAFDCVLALSITKWIHVNWGDEGLLEFFSRLVNALRPGGLLIIEPQPWRSYKAIRHKHNVKWPHVPLKQLCLRPEGFVGLLGSRFGMRVVKEATPHGGVEGFRRPVVVLVKPHTDP